MTPDQYVLKCYPFAKATESKTGLSAVATLTQAALESAWGNSAPGNMYFGQKDSDGLNGNEQLLLTTEDLSDPNKKFPVVVSVIQIGKKLWRYRIKDWFRKYNSPEECFTDHAMFLMTRPRYSKAWALRSNPDRFYEELQAAGYATTKNKDTGKLDYADKLKSVSRTIESILKKNNYLV